MLDVCCLTIVNSFVRFAPSLHVIGKDKETGQIINHSQWRLQELEEEYHQLQQQKDQLLNVSSLAIQDANRRNEEAQQQTRELEEENRFLKLQIQQLRDKVSSN